LILYLRFSHDGRIIRLFALNIDGKSVFDVSPVSLIPLIL